MVLKVSDVKYIVYLPKVLLKISEKDIIIKEKKIKDQIRKIASQKKHPKKISLRYEFIRIIWLFWRAYRGCKNCIFPWKSIWRDVFGVWRNIFCRLFSRCLFFLGQGENTPGKNPAETQSMKTQIKLGDIPVRKNVGKFMQNVGSRRLTPKSTKMTC